jgi:hypothetical protein
MNRVRPGVLLLVLTLLAAPSLSGQTPPEIKAQLIARMQVQYNTTSVAEEALIAAGRTSSGFASSTFEVRRVRFGADVAFNEWLTGKFESELAMGRLTMREMYINLGFSPEIQLRMGQYKRPFSLMELTSETVWPVIERGVRIRGLTDALAVSDSLAGGTRVLSVFRGNPVPGEEFEILTQFGYLSYDLGASLHGKVGQLGYHVGAFNGEGSDRSDTNDEKSFAGRLTYEFKTELPITLGGAVSYRETRTAAEPELRNATGTAYEADIEIGAFRRPGFRFLGEVTTGTNLAVDEDFRGGQGIIAYFKPITGNRVEGVEIAGRVSYGDPRTEVSDDEGLLLTPGFNVYFSGRNRLMINWDYYQAAGERLSGENALRLQAQFYY